MPLNPPVPDHKDLVARLDLMETMISEGRATTARYGWIFLMWGLLYCAAMVWCIFLPMPNLAWPVAILVGVATHIIVQRRQRVSGVNFANPRTHAIVSVWRAMGIGVSIFAFGCAFTHHYSTPVCLCGILIIVGLAHATSAMILRWAAQAIAAAIWWIAAIVALIFTSPNDLLAIFLLATICGNVLFGLYVMWLERRTPPPALPANA